MLALAVFVFSKPAKAPNTNEQIGGSQSLGSDQINESTKEQQDGLVMQPSINNEEFIMTSSSVSCSTTEVNGQVSRSCSGNIHIVPKSNNSMGSGLYKINEQTKLLRDGKEQELTTLQQLSQNQTVVRLSLVPGSDDMLAEIRY